MKNLASDYRLQAISTYREAYGKKTNSELLNVLEIESLVMERIRKTLDTMISFFATQRESFSTHDLYVTTMADLRDEKRIADEFLVLLRSALVDLERGKTPSPEQLEN